MKRFLLAWLIALTAVGALSFGANAARKKPDMKAALAAINRDELGFAIRTLSSDAFEGRYPASPGETRTIEFLRREFTRVGATPGNGGSFYQEVPLLKIANDHQGILKFSGGQPPLEFTYGSDFIGFTPQFKERIVIQGSEAVFVGFGIVAPEYGWNDYRGLDVRGKTVIMLVNDPGFYDPGLFRGKNMTYYGRWMYKFAEAGRQGAAAAILIHETEPASYGWDVVRNSWGRPILRLDTGAETAGKCELEAWITLDAARRLFIAAGSDLGLLKKAALARGFSPRALPLKAAITFSNVLEKTMSRNVIARLRGADREDECVIYTAHWDHFGKDEKASGDAIYNGALDNATGTAALIELAAAFARLGTAPRRSVLFMAVTGEEQGLLGSTYYVTHPVVPLAKTAAAINMDSLNIFGRTRDVQVMGYGLSDLDDYARAAAARQGRYLVPESHPERGGFYRSDHFPFVLAGVPALYAGSGLDDRLKGKAWGREKREAYGRKNYHQPSDEYDPGWDLSGMLEDIRLYFDVGCRLNMGSAFPQFKKGSPYQAAKR
jgi:Zn-dependent M28 family amino/carboxypeptidase